MFRFLHFIEATGVIFPSWMFFNMVFICHSQKLREVKYFSFVEKFNSFSQFLSGSPPFKGRFHTVVLCCFNYFDWFPLFPLFPLFYEGFLECRGISFLPPRAVLNARSKNKNFKISDICKLKEMTMMVQIFDVMSSAIIMSLSKLANFHSKAINETLVIHYTKATNLYENDTP